MITVTVEGDLKKPSILTYHDVGLNRRSTSCSATPLLFLRFFIDGSCFSGFLHHGKMKGVLKFFSLIHIDAPGQEENAPTLPRDTVMTCETLTNQIDQVLEHFGKKNFVGFGVGAGGWILLNYAVRMAESDECLALYLTDCHS